MNINFRISRLEKSILNDVTAGKQRHLTNMELAARIAHIIDKVKRYPTGISFVMKDEKKLERLFELLNKAVQRKNLINKN